MVGVLHFIKLITDAVRYHHAVLILLKVNDV